MRSTLSRLAATAAVSAVLAMPSVTLAGNAAADGDGGSGADAIRFTSFNASLNRSEEGGLIASLSNGDDPQARAVAEIIQRLDPDVILVNEFDYDAAGEAVALFQQNYLGVSQNGAAPIEFPHVYLAPSNTGIPSGLDLDNDGSTDGPGDAFGFGFFPGQFAMVLLSKHPIDAENVRTFQTFRWVDMPGALLPVDPDTNEPWYSPEELEVLRLSSKSHWDVPILVPGEDGPVTVHVLAAHPTPPVFDGPEDRNGRRNHDEIRFWADYVTPGAGDYIHDDAGVFGGLAPGARFVIMGDYNADPLDGDSVPGAIQQLLESPEVIDPRPASLGGIDAALRQDGLDLDHLGAPSLDTGDFDPAGPGNLRVDYVLPSADLGVAGASVFWPSEDDPLFHLVGPGFPPVSSDHRPVSVDVLPDGPAPAPTPFPASYGLELIGEVTIPTGELFDGTEVGGLSGLAYDPSIDAYLALSDDRGGIDDPRFYVLSIDLSDGSLDDGDVRLRNVPSLRDVAGEPFATNVLDPEGIAFTATGDLFIASEGDANALIPPFVDRFTPIGRQLDALPIPAAYLPGAEFGIRNNLAFESLTVAPDQGTLFTATENALFQDGPPATVEAGSPVRILAFDLAAGDVAAEYVHEVGPVVAPSNPPGEFVTNGLVELLALDGERLLALERSFSLGVGFDVLLFEVSVAEATDVAGAESIDGLGAIPASKRKVADLGGFGPLLDNVEGMTFGPVLPDGRRSLIVVSDNNFSPFQRTQFLAFAVVPCVADVDGDGTVAFGDLLAVLRAIGQGTGEPAADVNGDGAFDLDDILAVLAGWGPCT